MKKMVLFLVLAALALGGFLYYRSLRTTPEYSLLQAAKATQLHDMKEFERYVDVNSVTSHLLDQVADQGSTLASLAPVSIGLEGVLRMLKPQLTQAAYTEVERYIETGSVTAAAEANVRRPMGISLMGLIGTVVSPKSQFKGVKYTRQEGEAALVGLEFSQPTYDTTMVLEVKMLDRGDHWQATEITNTGAILNQVARLEKRKRGL
ncbi:DUF2939 domain-containing protein [Hymenobacter mucosus]|uniref:DUF2939 domain-containing protein n=1 Tax=Hymenobacter mucosus TaxID=1411120 RepID=A0A238WTB3_9BACT|nr:DUF2939 domain-containing protein [Hymenobacter mucosus]SNR49638.1 Protein of unknown function [Hymenobacter mucosus]